MNDQAAVLRSLASPKSGETPKFQCPFVVVTGGKGGVGKTSIAANFAVALASKGKRVLVADLDLGLANLDIFLRVFPRYTIGSVVTGEKTVSECVVEGPAGIFLLPGPNGVAEMAALSPESRSKIVMGLAEVSSAYDLVIADTAAGIAPDVLSFAGSAEHLLLVTSAEPAALTDAYAIFKLLLSRRKGLKVAFLINSVGASAEASQTAKKFQLVAKRFLDYCPHYLGWIPRDSAVTRASWEQKPFVIAYPDSLASASVRHLSQRLLSFLGT